jgi:hypothetical protein
MDNFFGIEGGGRRNNPILGISLFSFIKYSIIEILNKKTKDKYCFNVMAS